MSGVIDIITMGCSKNLVDSEQLIYRLNSIGFDVYHNPDDIHGGIAVVNTCGFIESAKQESIDMILELCQAKEEGRLERLYVMGCLSQRYKEQLEKEIPQVDEYFGKFDWKTLITRLADYVPKKTKSARRQGNSVVAPFKAVSCSDNLSSATMTKDEGMSASVSPDEKRVITTPRHYAYIKISEGCDRRCSYCAIPLITGRQVSRKMEDIEAEVRTLVASGTKEFQIIAQDSTSYGTDVYNRRVLPELIERLSDIEGVEWLRIHYAYPNDFPFDLLRVIRERENVCKYLDIALQHVNDKVLSGMHRNITSRETYDLLARIREEVPGIALRTTLMVGFPGEDEAAFEELERFVREVRFERMGAFAYSEEEGTFAAKHYEDSISEELKQQRLERIMAVQQRISAELCAERVGKTLKTVIDRVEGDYFVGRTQFDSPEVDGEVLIDAKKAGAVAGKLQVGQFYDARIVSSTEFDLFAEVDV